jgi:hypothetical protein
LKEDAAQKLLGVKEAAAEKLSGLPTDEVNIYIGILIYHSYDIIQLYTYDSYISNLPMTS